VTILTNVALSQVTAGGWNICYSGTYDETGIPIATILAGCGGSQLMLACRTSGSPTLTVAGFGLYSDATFPTAGTNTAVHNANGVAWYFNTSWSWGFAAAGDAVDLNSCDYSGNGVTGNSPAKKLCWHTNGGNLDSGYRCGATEGIGIGWDRLVLRRS